jgi:hypothetical protein
VGIHGPYGSALVERDVSEPLAIAGYEVQPAQHVVYKLLRCRRRALEHHHRRDVHVRRGVVLEMKKCGVERG